DTTLGGVNQQRDAVMKEKEQDGSDGDWNRGAECKSTPQCITVYHSILTQL
ncbi:uncharacterized, partial [Tachysurus ichikawai]